MPKKTMKKAYYQNSQTNTCKNEAWKPLFIRGLRGYCENEKSPCRALTLVNLSALVVVIFCENEKSPCRAVDILRRWIIASRFLL